MIRAIANIRNLSPWKKRVLYSILILFCVLLLVATPFLIYAGRVYYIKNFGIKLTASKDYPVTITEYYRQNDPQWKDDTIGNSGRKMGNTGCLISCVATAISNLDVPITPKELNAMLTRNDGFLGADLIWYKINEAIPEVDYRYSRIFNSKTIEKDLEKGLLPIVNVRYYHTGITHWVLIVGAKDGEFIICDPLDHGTKTKLLSEHGKVYAYRVIERTQ